MNNEALALYSLPIRVSHSSHAPALWHVEDQIGKPVATVYDEAQASLIANALNSFAQLDAAVAEAHPCWRTTCN